MGTHTATTAAPTWVRTATWMGAIQRLPFEGTEEAGLTWVGTAHRPQATGIIVGLGAQVPVVTHPPSTPPPTRVVQAGETNPVALVVGHPAGGTACGAHVMHPPHHPQHHTQAAAMHPMGVTHTHTLAPVPVPHLDTCMALQGAGVATAPPTLRIPTMRRRLPS